MRVRVGIGLVLAASALLLFVRAGSVPLLDPDESRFARTSVEMLRSGDLVVPRFGGEPRLVKPPLLHWIQSFVFSIAGPSERAARLHAAVATIGSLLLVAWIARRRFGEEGGTWASAVFITMPLVLVPGRVGTIEALLAVHVLAILALDMVEPDQPGPFRGMATGGLLGLAFLAKGPVGVILPLLLILAGRTAARRELLPPMRVMLQALAVCVAVVLPWGLAFVSRVGWDVTLQTLNGEVLERYYEGTAHVEPPWFYAKVAAVGFLPWLAPLVVGCARAWSMRKTASASTAIYAASALVAGLIFFSIGQSKLATYILPLAPLAAIVVTWELAREIEAPRQRTLAPTLLAATAAACALLLGLTAALDLFGAADPVRDPVAAVAGTVAWLGAAIFGAGAIVAGHAVMRSRPRRVYASVALATGAFMLVAIWFLFPAVGERKSAAPLVEAVPELASSRPVVTVEIRVSGLLFYADRAAEVLEMDGLEARIAAEDDALFVLADVDLPDVPPTAMAGLREIGRHGKYRVYEKSRNARRLDDPGGPR